VPYHIGRVPKSLHFLQQVRPLIAAGKEHHRNDGPQ
jgi:hypothetical protein